MSLKRRNSQEDSRNSEETFRRRLQRMFSYGNLEYNSEEGVETSDFRGGIQRGIYRKYLEGSTFLIQSRNSEETYI